MYIYLKAWQVGQEAQRQVVQAQKKEGDVLCWQRNPVLILQVEAGANSTNSKTQKPLIREKIETTQKEKWKKKKKRHKGIFKPLKAWEKALSKNHYSKVLMRLRLLEMRHLAYQGLWERRIEPEGKGFQMAGTISVTRNAQILHAQVVRAAWSTLEKGMLMPTPN